MSNTAGSVSVDMTDKLNYKAERFIQRHGLPVCKPGVLPVWVYLSWFFMELRKIAVELYTERRKVDYELWRRIVAQQLQKPRLTYIEHFESFIIQADQNSGK